MTTAKQKCIIWYHQQQQETGKQHAQNNTNIVELLSNTQHTGIA
jgi:hypothetical protein